MKPLKAPFFVSALALLGGCVAVPVDPGYYAESPGYYAPAPLYYAPPVYYPPPVFYGPSVGIGIYGGSRGHGHGGRRGHGHRHWRR